MFLLYIIQILNYLGFCRLSINVGVVVRTIFVEFVVPGGCVLLTVQCTVRPIHTATSLISSSHSLTLVCVCALWLATLYQINHILIYFLLILCYIIAAKSYVSTILLRSFIFAIDARSFLLFASASIIVEWHQLISILSRFSTIHESKYLYSI